MHRRYPALLSIICTIACSTSPALAQQIVETAPTASQTQDTNERISLTVGDILEILPSTDMVNPTYSWILTQDRTFIQAGRTLAFRYRF